VISGTPTGTFTGTSNFAATVTDSQTPTNATNGANLGIAISAPTLKITPATLPAGHSEPRITRRWGDGRHHAVRLVDQRWSAACRLNVERGTGAITGTPTGSVTGPINFTVKVTDAETPTAQSATAALSITITAAPLSVVTSSLPTGVDGSNYSTTLQAAGGVSPYTWQ